VMMVDVTIGHKSPGQHNVMLITTLPVLIKGPVPLACLPVLIKGPVPLASLPVLIKGPVPLACLPVFIH